MQPSGFGHSCNYHSRLCFQEEHSSAVVEQAAAGSYGQLRIAFSSWEKQGQVRFLSIFFLSFGVYSEILKEKTFYLSIILEIIFHLEVTLPPTPTTPL